MKITATFSTVFLMAFAASAQSAFNFTYQIDGLLPPAQSADVTSQNPNSQIPYLYVTVTPTSWLKASLSGTTTPAVLTVSLVQSGLTNMAPGSYAGDIQVLSPFSSNGLDFPVSLTVAPAAPRLSLSPSGFLFNAFVDGPPTPVQTLVVGASNTGVGVFSTYTTPVPKWLRLYSPIAKNPVAPWSGAGVAPVTISIAVDPTGLSPGSYAYAIPFNSSEGSNVTANVVLVVTAQALTVSANQLQFQCPAGLTNPPPQTVQVQSNSGTSLNATVNLSVPWLSANLQSGATPFNLSIQPDCAALAVGSYTGKVTITDAPQSDSQTVNVVLTVGQPILTVTAVTNAALPSMDSPPATVALAPRSMATIFGTNLADGIAGSSSPWTTPLSGTEIRLASDTCFDSSCDLVADLIYASPAQINFLVPDTAGAAPVPYRIIVVRDGQRTDDQSYMLGGPGRLIIDPSHAADSSVVFQVGYDCLFSSSLSDPASCGLSWSSGQDRAPVGAVTDAISGQLISTQNPVYQGRLITLWMTGLYGGVALDSQTGLRTGAVIAPVGFGVAQFGKDIQGTLGVDTPTTPNTPSVPIGTFMSPTPLWAGESPQFVGLDQINVAFPTCTGVPTTASEKRYDAFLTYTSLQTGVTSRIYIPFDVRVGDPDCQWMDTKTATSLALTANPNPLTIGQTTVLTATVSPSTASGVVTFFDGNAMLGSQTLSAGVGTLSVSALTVGDHSVTVVYNGDSSHTGNTAVLTVTVGAKPSTVAVASNANPLALGGSVKFTATVSPAVATGTVTFADGGTALGSGALTAGTATFSVNTLLVGSHSITATYSGDATYASSTSAVLTQNIVGKASAVNLIVGSSGWWGANVTFSANVTPTTATGTVTFFDGDLPNCNTVPTALGTATLSGGAATFTTTMTCTGANVCKPSDTSCVPSGARFHTVWAVYNGDADTASSISQDLPLLVSGVTTSITVTGNQNPSSNTNPTSGPLFTATVTPPGATGSVIFTYFNATSTALLACNGITLIPLANGQAVCNATPGLFPGPGTYGITATFYPKDDQYDTSTTYLALAQVVTP